MSVRAQTHAWELRLPPASKFVLLALADHADHAGRNIYPGIPLIAWKTGYSERHVTRIIGELLEAGILVIERLASGHTPASYRIDFTAGEKQASHDARPVRRRALTSSAAAEVTGCHPGDTQEGCQDVTPGVTSATERGDIYDTRGVTSTTERGDISDAEGTPVSGDAMPKTDHRARMQPSWNRQGTVREPPPPTEPPAAPALTKEEEQKILRMLIGKYHVGSEDYQNKLIAACPDADTLDASLAALLAGGMTIGPAMRAIIRTPPAVGEPYQKQALARRPAAPAPAPEGARRELTPDETRQRLAELRAQRAGAA